MDVQAPMERQRRRRIARLMSQGRGMFRGVFGVGPMLLFGSLALLVVPFTCSTRDAGDVIELRIWAGLDSTEQQERMSELLREYEQANPGVRVQLEQVPSAQRAHKYLAAMQAGVSADIVYIHWREVPMFAGKDQLLPLDELAARDGYDLDDFYAASLDAHSYGGQQVSLPDKGSTVLVFYNRNIIDAHNAEVDAQIRAVHADEQRAEADRDRLLAELQTRKVEYPNEHWTIDDFIHAATLLTRRDGRGRISQIGVIPLDAVTWIWSLGGHFAEDDMSQVYFDDPAVIEGVRFMWNLRNKWQITTRNMNARGEDPTAVDVFERGNVALQIAGPWRLMQYNEIQSFDWDIAMFPKGPQGRRTRYAGMGYGIWTGTAHAEASWLLLQWLVSPEVMTEIHGTGFTDVPARQSVAREVFAKQEAPFDLEVMVKSLDPAYSEVLVLPKSERWRNVERYFFDELDEALLERKTPEQAMRDAQRRAEIHLAAREYEVTAKDYVGMALLPLLPVVLWWIGRAGKGA